MNCAEAQKLLARRYLTALQVTSNIEIATALAASRELKREYCNRLVNQIFGPLTWIGVSTTEERLDLDAAWHSALDAARGVQP